jgi:ADP-ribose pyrophosphatase YjhB (NUDIX family)
MLGTSPNAAIPAGLRSKAYDEEAINGAKKHAAGIVFVSQKGNVLLLRRSDKEENWSGHWALPGGGVEEGETPEEGAAREAREEIGAGIRLVRLLAVLGGPDYEVTYPNGDRVAYVPAVYEAEIINGTPSPSDGELSEVAWFTPAELQALQLSRFTRAMLTATGHLSPRR